MNWDRGTSSIARFELVDQGGLTKVTFDHKAFPKGKAEHLASGWQAHYWDPLSKPRLTISTLHREQRHDHRVAQYYL